MATTFQLEVEQALGLHSRQLLRRNSGSLSVSYRGQMERGYHSNILAHVERALDDTE